MMTRITFLLVILLACNTLLQAQEKRSVTSEDIDKIFAGWTDDSKPGIAVGILNNGKIEFNKHWGLANLEHNIPINEQTAFLFPGMIDQLIAFSVLYLEEEGLIALDDKLEKYLPNLPKILSTKTVRNLLHHNSGLHSVRDAKILSGQSNNKALNEAEFYALLNLEMTCVNNEDESQLFDRSGMRLLQSLIENQSGLSFANFAKQNIFEPLGMTNSQIKTNDAFIKNRAQGYSPTDNSFIATNENNNYLYPDQFYTTTYDMCLWTDNFWRAKLGSDKLWKSMDQYVTENGAPVEEKNQSLFVGQHRYWNYQGQAKYYLIGQSRGYAAKVIRYPLHDLAIVVLGNFGRYNGHLATGCSDPYLEDYYVSPDYDDNPKFEFVKNDVLNKYTGKYWDHNGESMAVVTLEEDTLRYFEELYNWKTNLYPLGDNKFYIDVRDGFHVEFKNSRSGKDLILNVPGREEIIFNGFKPTDNWKDNAANYTGKFTNQQLGVYYEIVEDNEGLKLVHKSNSPILFTPKSHGEFKSTNRQFSRIKFTSNTQGQTIGFNLSNANSKNIPFIKSDNVASSEQIN